MAPRTKDAAPDTAQPIAKYLESQTEIVNALNFNQTTFTSTIMANTTALTTTMNTLLSVQAGIKTYLEANKITADSETVTAHPVIATLLAKDRSAIIDPINFNFSALSAPQPEADKKEEKKKREKKKPRDPTLPKRPQTAYFLFLAANRERVSKENPGDRAGDVSKKCTELYNAISEKEKQKFKDIYAENMKNYEIEMTAWREANGIPAKGAAAASPDATADPAEVANGDDEEEDASSSSSDESSSESEDEAPPPPPKEPTPPPVKTPKAKKTRAKKGTSEKKEAAPAAVPETPAVVPAESPKKKTPARSKKDAKASSPAKEPSPVKETSPTKETPATEKKKKRKSTGPDVEERKKKRRETHGEDY